MKIEDDPVANELLSSDLLMRLGYIGPSSQPKVVPIWYQYSEGEFIVVTGPKADKVRSLRKRPKVAITIDSDKPPYKVLMVDGLATVEEVDGMAPEYDAIVRKHLGAAADGYLARMKGRVKRQVRIRIQPTGWRILDFVKRSPRSLS